MATETSERDVKRRALEEIHETDSDWQADRVVDATPRPDLVHPFVD